MTAVSKKDKMTIFNRENTLDNDFRKTSAEEFNWTFKMIKDNILI